MIAVGTKNSQFSNVSSVLAGFSYIYQVFTTIYHY
jgi:hypothetical protein